MSKITINNKSKIIFKKSLEKSLNDNKNNLNHLNLELDYFNSIPEIDKTKKQKVREINLTNQAEIYSKEIEEIEDLLIKL